MPLFKKYFGKSLTEMKEENAMQVEIKSKPVDKRARVVGVIREMHQKQYPNLTRQGWENMWAERIDDIYDIGDGTEEIEGIEIKDNCGHSVTFTPNSKTIRIKIASGIGCSTREMTKAKAIFLAEGILSMCGQIE